MNGRVRSMCLHLHTQTAATLLALVLVMGSDSVAAGRARHCGNSLLQTLRLARLVQKESVDTIRTYKASQGDLSELICKVSLSGLPDASVPGLEASERMGGVHAGLQAFAPHLRRVVEQQTDLQLADSPLLRQLHVLATRSQHLDAQLRAAHQELFPNSPPLAPPLEPGTASLPPPQNVFQQKVYGCVLLRTYKDFLSNVCKYLRTLKNQVCGVNSTRRHNNTLL